MGCGQWTEQIPESMLYDAAANAWDQSFPDLNDQRRNHGGTFVPDLGVAGTPALWVFGGLDGNPIQSSEYYDVGPWAAGVKLIPKSQEREGLPGGSVEHTAYVKNETGSADSFDLAYGGNMWPYSGPASVGPVSDGEAVSFTVTVDIPAGTPSPASDTLLFTATGQTNPFTDTATMITTVPPYTGTVEGYIYDDNTGDPLPGYVTIFDYDDPDVEYETWTDPSGYYRIDGVLGGTYDIYGAAVGWARVDDTVMVTGLQTTTLDFYLPAPVMDWTPEAISETLSSGETKDVTLLISNTTGSADLFYRIDEIAAGTGFPAALEGPVPGIAGGVDPEVYEILAEPDATLEILVVMAEQADLSAAYDISDWSARGQYVYNALKAAADRSQARVRSYLDGQGIAYHSHISLNSLTLAAARSTVEALAAMPEVYAIRPGYTYDIPEPIFDPAIDAPEEIPWNLENIGASKVWEEMGVTGENIVVANIDTGVEYTHTALVEQYRGNNGDGTFTHDYNWWDPRGACEIAGFPAGDPCDNDSHGTHTMGSMVGNDDPTNPISATNAVGVAPGAQWMACKGCEDVLGWPCSTFALLECADFVLAPWDSNMANPDPDMRPHVVNNSWGGSAVDGWYFNAVAAWRAAGIFPAYSGGNDGPSCQSVHSPSDYYNAFASGAVDSTDTIAGFSSRGPSDLGTFKPQVTAPGVAVRSSIPGNDYGNASGTSMASPHSAGEVALIWSAQPELVGQVQVTEWLMEQTADPILDDQCGDPGPPNYVYGWGRINAYEAVSTALAYEWDVGWLDVSPAMGTVAMGDAAGIDISLDATALVGCYTATLKIETNDPYQGLDVFVPVQLCAEEAMNWVYLPIVVKNY
jgi:subtilisin family serine protease